jgi:hypothetical protein
MSLLLIIIGCYLGLVVVFLAFALALGTTASIADDQMERDDQKERAAELERLAQVARAQGPLARANTDDTRERQVLRASKLPLTR